MSTTNGKNKQLILESTTSDSIIAGYIAESFGDTWRYSLLEKIWYARWDDQWVKLSISSSSMYTIDYNMYFWLVKHLPGGFNADRLANVELLLRYELSDGS